MYWIVYGSFTAFFSVIGDPFLSYVIPFYDEIKLVGVMWLVMPQTQGALWLYRNYGHGWLQENEEEIDHVLVQARELVVNFGDQMFSKSMNWLQNLKKKEDKEGFWFSPFYSFTAPRLSLDKKGPKGRKPSGCAKSC